LTAVTPCIKGLMKMATSSAYMEVLHLAIDRGSGVSIPCSHAASLSRADVAVGPLPE
jgi:hypothetical protein